MAIEFRCSQCNQLLRVPDESVGKNARCPKCQALMQVPAASTAAAPTADTAETSSLPAFRPASPFAAPTLPSGQSPAPPAFTPAQPSPKPADPFSPAGASSGNPFADPAAAARPGGNPFGGGAVAPSLNPYATPAFAGYAIGSQYGPRTGLPWETRGQNFRSWWDTMVMVLGSPSQAFTVMRHDGGMGTPIMFNFWGLAAPMGLIACLFIPILILMAVMGEFNGGGGAPIAFGMGIFVGMILFLFIYLLLAVTIGAIIGSAILHVSLLMVGGARQGFETTFRVVSFSQGAIAPVGVVLGCIPYLGGLIQIVWIIVLTAIGISKAHEISGGKAALAVLLPAGLCFALSIAFVITMIAIDANH